MVYLYLLQDRGEIVQWKLLLIYETPYSVISILQCFDQMTAGWFYDNRIL